MDYMETKYPGNTATYETRMTAELNATMAAVNKDRAAG